MTSANNKFSLKSALLAAIKLDLDNETYCDGTSKTTEDAPHLTLLTPPALSTLFRPGPLTSGPSTSLQGHPSPSDTMPFQESSMPSSSTMPASHDHMRLKCSAEFPAEPASKSTPPAKRACRRSKKKKAPHVDSIRKVAHQKTMEMVQKEETVSQALRKAAKKASGHANARKKLAKVNAESFSHYKSRPSFAKYFMAEDILADVRAKKVEIRAEEMNTGSQAPAALEANAASTGYVGLNDSDSRNSRATSLEELVGEGSKYGFKYVQWDGVYVCVVFSKGYILMIFLYRTATPIVSLDGYLIGVLAGNPDPSIWPQVHADAVTALQDAYQAYNGPRSNVRGAFSVLRTGVTHGGGTTRPCNTANSDLNEKILSKLNAHPSFQRIAGFSSCMFASILFEVLSLIFLYVAIMSSWAPGLHEYYTNHLKALHENDPSLRRVFQGSVFSSSTYNLGPQTVCYRHADFANLPFGWCGITSFGSYDYTKGGHLVLWDCHLVIEFPPGSTILIPSAVVSHSNTPIKKDESRYSFTQYTSGGLFRWVDQGFRTSISLRNKLSPEEKAEQERLNKLRWEFGLSLTPCLRPTPTSPEEL